MHKCSFLFFFILIQFGASTELNFDFLNSKTIDVVRQIFYSTVELFSDQEKKADYKIRFIFELQKSNLIKQIKDMTKLLLNETKMEENELFEIIKENRVFKIDKENDIDKLIKNEELPKQFLMNFALNMDKYSRTEKQEINGIIDYLNYLTKKELRDYLFDKLKEYPNLKSPDNFRKYILNDIDYNFADIDAYIKDKSKNELIQIIYGFEKYCFNAGNKYSSECLIPYKMYNHDNLDSYNRGDFDICISTYKRKLDFKDLDKFISNIENRGFSYINPKTLFLHNTKKELIEYVKAFETYFNRQNNIEQSLDKRDEYIELLEAKSLKDILEWSVDLYPELMEKTRYKNILSSQTNLQYGQVKEFLKISDRSELLKYAYNIHTFQENITSKYETHLIDFIRLNDNKLYDQIFTDTNNNILLQEKTNFEHYASLYQHDIKEYLKILQRNQLITITKRIIELYLRKNYVNQDGKTLSFKKNLFESIDIMNDEDILKTSFKYADDLNLNDIYSIQYLENQYPHEEVRVFYLYFYNIMDFFRSTDINYLRLWIRRYELEIRKIRSERYLAGGLKNNFLNIETYSKKDLLKILDVYVYEYPELFYPEKFLKISGLDNGITPHKFLLENQNNSQLFEDILFSIITYMQTKNNQINFDYDEFISMMIYKPEDENDLNIEYINNNLIYSVFRIINIFPELNNMVFFNRICLDETTRSLHYYQFDQYFNSNRNLQQIVDNINEYYSNINFAGLTQNDNLQKDDSEETKIQTIKNFMNKPFQKSILFKVLEGDFYSLFYNFTMYIKDQSEMAINNMYYALYDKHYVKSYIKSKNLQINEISEAVKKYKELQNITTFDSEYNYINIHSENYEKVEELYNYLNNINNRQLFYYCLIANLIKIGYEEEDISIKEIPDIYLKIHYMSRNEMIRYILDIAKFKDVLKTRLSAENLRILTKKYFLDLGSDNVYDLTMF